MSESQCPYCQSQLNANAFKCHACAEWVVQVHSWNWFAFLFGAFWYMAKGMWAKGFAILGCVVLINTVLSSFGSGYERGEMSYPTASAFLLLYGIYCGVHANKDKQRFSIHKDSLDKREAVEGDMPMSSSQSIL